MNMCEMFNEVITSVTFTHDYHLVIGFNIYLFQIQCHIPTQYIDIFALNRKSSGWHLVATTLWQIYLATEQMDKKASTKKEMVFYKFLGPG